MWNYWLEFRLHGVYLGLIEEYLRVNQTLIGLVILCFLYFSAKAKEE